eukprot:EC097326.1.p1 GENE.EC097326.1~~EC097326.1.p1  ORF type:complete len:142 (-),score=8.76 EC097326.1:157-582(-)
MIVDYQLKLVVTNLNQMQLRKIKTNQPEILVNPLSQQIEFTELCTNPTQFLFKKINTVHIFKQNRDIASKITCNFLIAIIRYKINQLCKQILEGITTDKGLAGQVAAINKQQRKKQCTAASAISTSPNKKVFVVENIISTW